MTTMTTERQEQHKEKRAYLKSISTIAKEFLNSEECADWTINKVLIEKFHKSEEHQEFKTLQQWNQDGYQVIKGSKSFLVWGKPTRLQKETTEPNDEEDDFFPLCYLFSNAQVEKRDAKN